MAKTFKSRRKKPGTPLTDFECENAKADKKPYKMADRDGLYLNVMPNGSKHWRMKYVHERKERLLAFGSYPEVSLLKARDKCHEAQTLRRQGLSPAEVNKERKQAQAAKEKVTFELVAREWHKLHKDRWTTDYGKEILHRLEMDIFPEIGALPIYAIRPRDILDALRKIEKRGAYETARRSLQYCSQIFRYAVIIEQVAVNPTPDLKGALKPFKRGHFASIEIDELPEFLQALDLNNARLYTQTRNAIRLLMLTFVRTSELIGVKWEEINFETCEWIIPASRMKMRRPHIVPLSRQAIEILKEQKELTGEWEWVFPNQAYPRKHMSNNTILKALERLGYKGRMTGHGFRALAMSAIKEKLGYRHEPVDWQLAHAPSTKNDRAYDRTKFLDERKVMMQKWADYLDGLANMAKVVRLNLKKTA